MIAAPGQRRATAFGRVVAEANAAVVKEAGEGRPARQHVVDRLGGGGVARQPGAFRAHPLFKIGDERLGFVLPHRQPVAARLGVDPALNGEDLVYASHRVDRQRRLAQVGLLEEVAPAVAPKGRLGDAAARRKARRGGGELSGVP